MVFKIDAAGNESILYNFKGGATDGCYPQQGLITDKRGNLFGTTAGCGSADAGIVLKLSKSGKEVVLHNFTGADGRHAIYGHLLLDTDGTLYGLTSSGGNGDGTLYKLSKTGKVTVLYTFAGGLDGQSPGGTPARDKSGNFYGTAVEGGQYHCGTIWKVSEKGAETTLHSFDDSLQDGAFPYEGVILDSKGNLLGTTAYGGAYGRVYGDGTLWEFSRQGRFTLLHSFDYTGGAAPFGELLRDQSGTLYGTAGGGIYGYGTVWKYVP